MRAFKALTTLISLSSKPTHTTFACRFYAAQSQRNVPSCNDDTGPQFDSSVYPSFDVVSHPAADSLLPLETVWDENYRAKADSALIVDEKQIEREKRRTDLDAKELKRRQAVMLSKALLEASLRQPDQAIDEQKATVLEEYQKSVSVGIIGPPNAGKSCLTNRMVGKKVAAVSRKSNTTANEVLGVMTRGDTQISFFDTPGLMLKQNGFPHSDVKIRVESAWSSINLYDVLIVTLDTERHLNRPDSRVIRLIERMGSVQMPNQKRVLCLGKVDLVVKRSDLLKVREEFKDLPGYERIFLVSGMKGAGVRDLTQYLLEQAVKRPWNEDPVGMSEDDMRSISLEVLRERFLDHIHQEIPYQVEYNLVGWSEVNNGVLKIEYEIVTHKESQKRIILGKNCSRIGKIGTEANAELRSLFNREVHLLIKVKLLKSSQNTYGLL